MKSLKEELEKIKTFLQIEDVIDTKRSISLYTLKVLIDDKLNKYKKYNIDNKKTILDKIIKDLNNYRGNIFNKNRNFLKGYKIDDIFIEIEKKCDKPPASTITVFLNKGMSKKVLDGTIKISKYLNLSDIFIECNKYDDYSTFSPKEKDNIKDYIYHNYYNNIVDIFNDLEELIILLEMEKDEINHRSIDFCESTTLEHYMFDTDLFKIAFNTNPFGNNRIVVKSMKEHQYNIGNKLTLLPTEYFDFIEEHKDLILKKLEVVTHQQLPTFYKNIVTNSEYYKNLENFKLLEKKPKKRN